MADDDAIAKLAGAEGVERVLQKGDFYSSVSPFVTCEVVYADGDEPVEVLSGNTLFEGPSRTYVLRLEDLLVMQDHTAVEPGVYVADYRDYDGLAVFFACDTGEEMPWLMLGTLYARPAEGGERWTPETVEAYATRLAAVTHSAHECPGDVWPLTPEDGQRLINEFARRYPTLL